EHDDLGRLPRASISVKPTALAPAYHPVTREDGLAQATELLLPFLRRARDEDVSVWFDMEHYDVKELTQELFRRLVGRAELDGLHAGIVVQAYLRDSYDDLQALLAWARGRATPIGVRLVKGAYWDTETITARAN